MAHSKNICPNDLLTTTLQLSRSIFLKCVVRFTSGQTICFGISYLNFALILGSYLYLFGNKEIYNWIFIGRDVIKTHHCKSTVVVLLVGWLNICML